MKKLIIIACVALMSVASAMAQEMSEALKTYLSGCVAMREAVENNDFPALTDAKLILSNLELIGFDEGDYTAVNDESKTAISAPKIIFTSEFAADMIKKGIISIEEDATDAYQMRGEGELQLLNASIAPHSKASFTSLGVDECEMLIFALSDAPVGLNVEVAGVPVDVKTLPDGAAFFASWTLPSEPAEYTFTVINDGDKPATFVIARN